MNKKQMQLHLGASVHFNDMYLDLLHLITTGL